jgi:CheY-like chemotaxis protein
MQKQKSSIFSGELPLKGKSALIVEDNALVAISAEFSLRDAGAAVVRIANSVASAKSALDEGFPFDVALVDLHLGDGDASALVQILSERGVAVVITTGDEFSQGRPALRPAIDILLKPYTDRELINALMKCAAAAPLTPAITIFAGPGMGRPAKAYRNCSLPHLTIFHHLAIYPRIRPGRSARDGRAALSRTPLMVMMTGRAALDNKITKQLDDLWQRQADYRASLQRIADAQRAVTENKLLGDSDPSREAILLADYQEALNQLLETGARVNRPARTCVPV